MGPYFTLIQASLRFQFTHHRTKSVRRLPNAELFVVALPLSCCHVIDDGVTPHIFHSVCFLNLEPTLANDDTNFSLIINRVRKPRMGVYWLSMSNNTRCTLGEDNRVCRLICFVAGEKNS